MKPLPLLILLALLSRPTHAADLTGTWRETDSTNTIRFQQNIATIAPVLVFGYTLKDTNIIFQLSTNIVIDKLDVRIDPDKTIIKELRSHNLPPYHDWPVPFQLTNEQLKIFWPDKPKTYQKITP